MQVSLVAYSTLTEFVISDIPDDLDGSVDKAVVS